MMLHMRQVDNAKRNYKRMQQIQYKVLSSHSPITTACIQRVKATITAQKESFFFYHMLTCIF